MISYKIILQLSLCTLFFGVFFGVFSRTPLSVWIFIFSIVCTLVYIFIRNKKIGNVKRCVSIFIILSISFSLGFLRGLSEVEKELFLRDKVQNVGNQTLSLKGTVSENSEIKSGYTTTYLDSTLFGYETKIKLSSYSGESFSKGDYLELRGKLGNNTQSYLNKLETGFSYNRYLESKNICCILNNPQIIKKVTAEQNFQTILFHMKQKFVFHVEQNTPRPESSIILGVVFGIKDDLNQSLLTSFKTSGLTHVLVLSGYNLILFVSICVLFFQKLPFRFHFLIKSIFLWGIVLFVGFSSPVLRASLMLQMAFYLESRGRENESFHSLMLVLAFVILLSPFTVLYDPSFQLSFLATFAIMVVAPIFEDLLFFIPNFFEAKKSVSAVLAVHLLVFPLSLFLFGSASFLGILTAIPATFLVMIIMFFGLSLGIFGFIPILKDFLAFVSYLSSHFLIKLSDSVSSFGVGVLASNISFNEMLAIYLFIILFILFLNFIKTYKKKY